MMHARVFQAQALDNSSPDHLRLAEHGEELRSPNREKIYSGMANISAKGIALFEQDGVKLIVKGNAAVLQVLTEERDDAGRLAPVVCWIEIDGKKCPEANDVGAVWASLERFITTIGRSFSEPKRLAAQEALGLLAKKKPSNRGLISLTIALLWHKWAIWLQRILATFKNFGK